MRQQGIRLRWLVSVLAAALAASAGCVSCLHPVVPISDEAAARTAALPQACRNHVYIFLLDGPSPLDLANLGGVRDALLSLGYIKTYSGECWHTGYFKDEILRIHHEDEAGRFVVMGFSLGANAARDLAAAAAPDGVTIDLLVYCGGVALADEPRSRPANAIRIVNVLGQGADSFGPALEGAENVHYPDASHFGSPTHPYTMTMLGRELTEVASRVPVIDPRPAAEPTPEMGPPPRPAAATRETLPSDEWDFLKPTPPYPQPAKPAPPEMPKAP